MHKESRACIVGVVYQRIEKYFPINFKVLSLRRTRVEGSSFL